MGRVCLRFKENIGFMQGFLILRPDVNRREYTLIYPMGMGHLVQL